MNKIFDLFSSWYRLKKFIAWALRYRAKLRVAVKQRRAVHAMTVDELKTAEREIMKQVQRECFQDEFAALVGIDPANPAVNTRKNVGSRNQLKSSNYYSKVQ